MFYNTERNKDLIGLHQGGPIVRAAQKQILLSNNWVFGKLYGVTVLRWSPLEVWFFVHNLLWLLPLWGYIKRLNISRKLWVILSKHRCRVSYNWSLTLHSCIWESFVGESFCRVCCLIIHNCERFAWMKKINGKSMQS